ncbi:MAG: polysaccharide biosynthesis/export family protein [Rhodoferax sp.]|nr:polysaccharide biosynthesis/export family protein [Rhodoferax sp.]
MAKHVLPAPQSKYLSAASMVFAMLLLMLGGCTVIPGWRMGQGSLQASTVLPDVELRGIDFTLVEQLQPRYESLREQVKPYLRTADYDSGYRIAPGDVLGIMVWLHPEFIAPVGSSGSESNSGGATGFSVNSQGSIQFPLVGTLEVQGLTEVQARDKLTRALSNYLRNPQITLQIQSYRSQKIFIDGAVQNPGQLTINNIPMTLAEAIGRVGGLTARGDSSQIDLTRQGQHITLNLPALLSIGIAPSDILLKANDLVRVTPSDETKVSVLGEVMNPSMVPTRNGRMSLNEALAEAGGLVKDSADARQIYVIRAGPAGKTQVFHLDALSPVMLVLADRFELQARDIVYVDAAPLAQWNRAISLLIPSVTSAQSTQSIIQNQ